ASVDNRPRQACACELRGCHGSARSYSGRPVPTKLLPVLADSQADPRLGYVPVETTSQEAIRIGVESGKSYAECLGNLFQCSSRRAVYAVLYPADKTLRDSRFFRPTHLGSFQQLGAGRVRAYLKNQSTDPESSPWQCECRLVRRPFCPAESPSS